MAGGTPLLFSSAGPVATPPATLQQDLLALVAAEQPGYTAALPGILIEDISSTDVGALTTIDQARVDAVNNVTPYGANPYILKQLGAQFGIPEGRAANASAFVVFTGSAGYVIPPGFLVSDGTNSYAIQDGGVVATGGTTSPLYVVATNSNIFAIPANTITTNVTSVPSPYTLTVTNPLAGIPAQAAQTIESYRAQVTQGFQVGISGFQTYLKTLLQLVPGVNPRLISVLPNGSNWEVIVGGGDPYQVAGAIYAGVSNTGYIVGSAVDSGRDVTVTLYDAPNTYSITFVVPPQITTKCDVIWNTTLTGFTAGDAVNQYIITATQSYINSIPVGQPINLLQLTEIIQNTVSSVLPIPNLTTLTFTIKQNGTTTPPTAGTSIIPPLDDESYFQISPTDATSVQG